MQYPRLKCSSFLLLRIVIYTVLYTHDNHARGISEKGVKRDRFTLSTVVGFDWLVFIRPGGNLPDAIHCFIPHSLLLSIKSRPFPSDRANHLFYCFLAGFHDKAIDEVDWALSLELGDKEKRRTSKLHFGPLCFNLWMDWFPSCLFVSVVCSKFQAVGIASTNPWIL